jgi:FtsH-binding integral membrane protein
MATTATTIRDITVTHSMDIMELLVLILEEHILISIWVNTMDMIITTIITITDTTKL